MDLNNNNIFGETKEDRISELPDPLLHYILSFIDTKYVARTAILSKRWNHIWTSIPTLEFPYWYFPNYLSLSDNNKFMDFVDTTLLRHDPSSSIQKFSLDTDKYMNASQVRSWIENLVRCNVEELRLCIYLDKPFIPLSVFTCVSLIKLVLSVPFNMTIHLPESFSCPKLKSLTLCGIQFTDEQYFFNCPVLENLILRNCTWFGVRDFCISTPTLKLLEIDDNGIWDEDCVLKIDAPNLVSLSYHGNVPKEYVLFSSRDVWVIMLQLLVSSFERYHMYKV